jgi:hypothetical protein
MAHARTADGGCHDWLGVVGALEKELVGGGQLYGVAGRARRRVGGNPCHGGQWRSCVPGGVTRVGRAWWHVLRNALVRVKPCRDVACPGEMAMLPPWQLGSTR